MWNKRREDEYAPRPAAPPAPAEPAREGIPMSTMPARPPEPEAGRGSATLGKSVLFKGQLYSREDLYLDGEVEGTVELPEHKLTVGPNGKVHAAVKAREIVVLGAVHGNVEAGDKIDIRKDAKLVGDIKTTRIVIEDGAYFKGSIDISRPEAARPPAPPPKPQPVAAPMPAPPPPVTAAVGAAGAPAGGELKR